jgi:hypothetical protein
MATWLFAFPVRAAARRSEWNDVVAVLDWLGIADCSCHQINPYFAGRRAEPHNLGLFALLILFDMACHVRDLNCRTVRWQPSLCPRACDHLAGVGYRNYFSVFNGQGVCTENLICVGGTTESPKLTE